MGLPKAAVRQQLREATPEELDEILARCEKDGHERLGREVRREQVRRAEAGP